MKTKWALLFLLVSIIVDRSYQQFKLELMEFTQPGNVPEDPTVEVQIAEIMPTTTNTATIDSCRVTSRPNNGPFDAQQKGGKFYVYYNAASDLNYKTTNFYELTVICTSGFLPSDPNMLFVYVQPNLPPIIKNYRYDSVSISAKNFKFATDTAYTLVVTDPENDNPLTVTLTNQFPNMGYFALDSADDKQVKVTKELRCITVPSFMLTFSVTDGKNTIDDFKVAVTLEDLNKSPFIKNLPHAIYIREDSQGGTVFKLDVEDPDNSPGPTTTTCTISPADSSKFQYVAGTSSITLTASSLDYETRNTYTITCDVNDGCLSANGADKLTIYVQNVNEGVSFDSTDYSCKLQEGGTRTQYCTLPLTVTDLDNYPIASIDFEPSADSDRFYYDKNTMRVYLNDPYDVDSGSMPLTADLVLKVVDTGGSTATATVHITISDANDNTCQFSKDVSYSMIDQSTAQGILDNFAITDGDLTSPNKDVVVVSRPTKDSGNYVEVSNQGDVSYTNLLPTSRSGTSCILLITCKDKGSPVRSAFATVIVSYTVITTTTVTTVSTTVTEKTKEIDLWDYGWFVAVFSLLMLCVFACLVAAVAFIIYKCCCYKTVGTPRNRIRPISPDDGSIKRSYSVFDDDDDDFNGTSFRSGYNNQRHLGNPRQIPALEYK